jgi:hypothetical protein
MPCPISAGPDQRASSTLSARGRRRAAALRERPTWRSPIRHDHFSGRMILLSACRPSISGAIGSSTHLCVLRHVDATSHVHSEARSGAWGTMDGRAPCPPGNLGSRCAGKPGRLRYRCELTRREVSPMRAANKVAAPFPTARPLDTPAVATAQLLTSQNLPGLILVSDIGRPWAVLPGTHVLCLAVPRYRQDGPALTRVADGGHSGLLLQGRPGGRSTSACPGSRESHPWWPQAPLRERSPR